MEPIPKNAMTKPTIIPTIGTTPKIERIINPNKNNQKDPALDQLNLFWNQRPIKTEKMIFET